jgi:hypothetical protein
VQKASRIIGRDVAQASFVRLIRPGRFRADFLAVMQLGRF